MSSGNGGSGWHGTRVLVTGAAGFIGSHLTEELVRQGASVRAFIRYTSRNDHGWLKVADPELVREVEIFVGDLCNPEAVHGAMAGCSTVFHLGALIPIPYSYRHPREYVDANVVGAINVLEAARRADIATLVHTSSSEVYGTAQSVPIAETHPINAQSPYAATKVAADQLALSYQRSFGVPVVVARPFNTYGARQPARAVIPAIVSQALTRDTIELGSLTPTRDFLFVEDTVRGLMACASRAGLEGEVVNLGTGTEISVLGVAEKVMSMIGTELPIVELQGRTRPPSSEVERLVADVSKAERLLGWRPHVSIDEGLARVTEWMRDEIGRYNPHVYDI